MSFAKFLIEKWLARPAGYDDAHGLPIRAVEGRYYSTLTGSDPPTIEIDWSALERDIAEFEAEFARGKLQRTPGGRMTEWPATESTPQDTVRAPCPDCPDGNVWDENGPRDETCPTCSGAAFVWISTPGDV